uniref:Las1-like protein n=1 Tax=Panagrellus redivivus TaxID=6233 RepID=A0A7E4VHL4_PANRE
MPFFAIGEGEEVPFLTLTTAYGATSSAFSRQPFCSSSAPASHSFLHRLCVNYVSEVCQQANGLQSIANAVSHMDIPEWIVGIRHRATHNTMPPLEVFRRGLAFFRSWLWTKYWSKPLEEAIAVAVPKLVQEQRLAIDRSHDDERACRDVLSDFVKWRNLDPSSMIDDPTQDSKFNAISAKIDQMPDVMTKFLVKNVFTMSMAKLKECDIAFTLDNGVWKMPHAFQLYWSPVIILYMQKKMMTKLISVFVKYMFEKDTPVMISQQCSGWVHSLCDMILKLINFDIETTEMAEWRIIANQMLSNAGAFRDETIRLVLNKVPVYSKKKTDQLIRLIELRKINGKAKGEGGDGIASRNFKIAERNLKFCAKDGANSGAVLPDETTGAFRVAQVNFEEVPLGLYPGQSADMLDLTLD